MSLVRVEFIVCHPYLSSQSTSPLTAPSTTPSSCLPVSFPLALSLPGHSLPLAVLPSCPPTTFLPFLPIHLSFLLSPYINLPTSLNFSPSLFHPFSTLTPPFQPLSPQNPTLPTCNHPFPPLPLPPFPHSLFSPQSAPAPGRGRGSRPSPNLHDGTHARAFE